MRGEKLRSGRRKGRTELLRRFEQATPPMWYLDVKEFDAEGSIVRGDLAPSSADVRPYLAQSSPRLTWPPLTCTLHTCRGHVHAYQMISSKSALSTMFRKKKYAQVSPDH